MKHFDEADVLTERRSQTRLMLKKDFAIDSAFVRVPELARVLGLAECSIYSAIRAHRFFIPHRMLLTSPAVKLDDLVDWYCSEGQFGRRGLDEDAAVQRRAARKAADDETWKVLRRSVTRR